MIKVVYYCRESAPDALLDPVRSRECPAGRPSLLATPEEGMHLSDSLIHGMCFPSDRIKLMHFIKHLERHDQSQSD